MCPLAFFLSEKEILANIIYSTPIFFPIISAKTWSNILKISLIDEINEFIDQSLLNNQLKLENAENWEKRSNFILF